MQYSLITLLIISIHQIDASHNDDHEVQPLIEYIRQRRHQVYDVEPNEYIDQRENYPKVTVIQHKKKGSKHKKPKNVKHVKVKKDVKIPNQKQIPRSNSVSNYIRNRKHRKGEWVQESYKESNISESDEKHTPVDIVVHIKMNE